MLVSILDLLELVPKELVHLIICPHIQCCTFIEDTLQDIYNKALILRLSDGREVLNKTGMKISDLPLLQAGMLYVFYG
jgi:hypothetical protein